MPIKERTEHNKEVQKAYHNRMKNNPEYIKKRQEYNTKYFFEKFQDKEWVAKNNARQKEYALKNKKQIKHKAQERKLIKLQQKIEKLKNELNQ